MARVLFALAIVIGLIFLLKWGSRRMFVMPSAQRSSRVVQVLSRSVVSPRQQLVLVQVGGRLLVLADGGTSMSPLCEIADPDEVAKLLGQLRAEREEAAANSFGGLFDRVRKRFGKDGDDEGEEADRRAEAAARAERSQLLGPAESDDEQGDEPDDLQDDDGYDERRADASVVAARGDLEGLRQKLRFVAEQFTDAGGSAADPFGQSRDRSGTTRNGPHSGEPPSPRPVEPPRRDDDPLSGRGSGRR